LLDQGTKLSASVTYKQQNPTNLEWLLNLVRDQRGRRFISSLPDQSFQVLKLHFWFSVYSDGVEIVDGACIDDSLEEFALRTANRFPRRMAVNSSVRT
jgi:hypothetical protein